MSVHYLIDPLDVMTPDDNPDHDPDDPRCCACDDCDEIAREQEAEEQGDWRRDEP